MFFCLSLAHPLIWNHILLSAASLEVIEMRSGGKNKGTEKHRAVCVCVRGGENHLASAHRGPLKYWKPSVASTEQP